MTESIGNHGEVKEPVQEVKVPSVQVVLMREGEDGPEVFLGHRIAGGFKNQWGFPGGKLDEGETPEQAACREVEEETGVKIAQDSLDFLRSAESSTVREINGTPTRYDYQIQIYVVQAQNLSPHNASPTEHSAMQWISVKDALSMHDKAIEEASARGISESPDKIPNALAPRTYETIKMLSEMKQVSTKVE